jgi:serpin B
MDEAPVSRSSASFAEDHNAFSLRFYGQLLQRPGNLFFSPFSIRTALGMTYAGARGETAEEMSRALRFPSPDETMHLAFSEIIRRLNAPDGGKSELAVANALWGQEGARIQQEFLDIVTRQYCGDMKVVNFRQDPEAAGVKINKWVKDKTKKKIRELIPAGSLTTDTRLVLVNAIYFKGLWVLQFQKRATRDEPFYLETGEKVQAPLMYQKEEVRYLKADTFQAVDLAYQGGNLSMLVLLPDKKDGLGDLETKFSAQILYECVAKMCGREVKLFLPRFRMTWGGVELGTYLKALGMLLAFTPRADFSGITGYEPPHEDSLYISDVFHKAFVEVNEEGTEATAATAVPMVLSMPLRPRKPPPVPIFRADHPFLFAIRDRKSGAILFLGRVVDPTQES